MVRSSLARISIGGFSALLSVALLLMVGGLIASDRAMRRATMVQTRIDAQQSAVAVGLALEAHLRGGASLETVSSDSALLAVVQRGPDVRSAAAIVAGNDTILAVGERSAFTVGVTHAVPLAVATDTPWTFVVAHSHGVEP